MAVDICQIFGKYLFGTRIEIVSKGTVDVKALVDLLIELLS